MGREGSLARATLVLTGVGLLTQFFGFVTRIALSRLAGAEAVGLYQLLMPAYGVLQALCISGLAVCVSVLSGQFHARRNERALRQLLSTGLRTLALLWLPVALVVFGGARWIAAKLLGDVRIWLGLVILIPALLLTGVENLQKQQLYGRSIVNLPARVEIGEKLIHALAVVVLLLLFHPQDPELAVGLLGLALLLSEIFSALTLTVTRLREEAKHRPVGPGIEPELLHRRMSAVALPVCCTALAGNLLGAVTNSAIPRLLVSGGMAQEEALAQFGILMGMTLPLLGIPTAFLNGLNLALQPRLTQQRALGRMDAFRSTGEKALRWVAVLVLPVLALIAALGEPLGRLLFAQPRAGDYIVPMAVGMAFGCFRGVFGAMLNALEQQRRAAAISLSCGAFELVLTLLLTERMGLAGVVVSALIPGVAATGLSVAVVRERCGNWRPVGAWLIAPVLSSVLAGLLTRWCYRWVGDRGLGDLPAMVIAGLIGAMVYLAALRAQGEAPVREGRDVAIERQIR